MSHDNSANRIWSLDGNSMKKVCEDFLPLVLLKPAIDQLEVSALLTFDGRVRAYHGCNG